MHFAACLELPSEDHNYEYAKLAAAIYKILGIINPKRGMTIEDIKARIPELKG